MSADASVCLQTANSDLLGLGVRVGTYLQVFSAILNLKLDSEDAPGAAWLQVFTSVPIQAFALTFLLDRSISNAIFLANSNLAWMQLLIMPAVLLMPAVRCLRLLVVLISGSLLFSFGVLLYYWATGYQRVESTACSTFAFFFAKVEAFGWFRWFNLALLGVAAVAYLAAVLLLVPPTRFARGLMARARELNRSTRLGALLLTLWAVLLIAVELTISWNDVSGVYSVSSTGQMIPLLVGAGSVARDVYFWHSRTRACLADVQQQQQPTRRRSGGGTAEVQQQDELLHGAKVSV